MLRRHSTKSKSDLHRRKSTTSVRSVPLDHISVAVAQRDAKLAAVHAFSRGQERRSAEMPVFPPPHGSPRHNENSSPAQLSRHDSVSSRKSEHDLQGLGRRQSVRFVGPDSGLHTRPSRASVRTAVPDQQDATQRRPFHTLESSQNVGSLQRTVLRDPESIHPPDRSSSRGKTLATPKPAPKQAYLQTLAPDNQQYTPEDDIASMPSSFRRVRKTRSMLTTRNAMRNSGETSQGTPLLYSASTAKANQAISSTVWSRLSFLNRNENDHMASTPILKTPKSMSFLRHRRDHADVSAPDQDPAFDNSPIMTILASREHSPRSRNLPKPSMFFGSKGSKTGQNMRKTLRTSSSSGALPGSGTRASIPVSIHGSMRVKARKVSASIKAKFRNLFINKSEDDAMLPAQQIEAQRSHVAGLFEDDHFGDALYEARGLRERSSVSRVSSHIPSLHAVPSSERLRSRRGSIESLGSEARRVSSEGRSRVTSWASTEVNTVVAHRSHENSEDGEKQRLPVITEYDLHAPLPPMSRPKLSLQTITSQEELSAPIIGERLPLGVTVDSQRVYSALMKRMSETKQQFTELIEEQRKSSDGSDPFRTLSPPTSDGTSDSGGPATFPHAHHSKSSHRDSSRSSSGVANRSCQLGDDVHYSLSPPVHLTPKGAELSSKPIADRSSAFFGSPTSHLFRTRSPWRRSLQDTIQKGLAPSDETSKSIAAASATEMADINRADSASIYSQDTQVHKLEMRQDFPFEGGSHSLNTREEASLYANAPTYRPTGERLLSTASSVDWKTRLSYDVKKTEGSPPSPTRVSGERPSEVEYVVPTMPRAFGHGHVREAAQIVSYEEDEYNSSPAVHMPTNPTTPLGSIEPNVMKLTPQQRSSIQTTPPPAAVLRENIMPASTRPVSPEDDDVSFTLPKDAMWPRASPLDSNGSCGESKANASSRPQTPSPEAHPIRQSKSLAHIQSFGRIRADETGSPRPLGSPTVRLMRKTATKLEPNTASAASTPGFSGAFEQHFGSLPRRLSTDAAAKENRSPHEGTKEAADARDEGRNVKGHNRGGKTMVEMFLHSRGRQRESGDRPAFV